MSSHHLRNTRGEPPTSGGCAGPECGEQFGSKLGRAPSGIEAIAAERERHFSKGFSDAGDDRQTAGELALAASCYALPPTQREHPLPMLWPWSGMVWRPTKDRIRELAKAGALIAAEIDRLNRAGGAR